jgi:hypothetical protein
LTVLAVESLVMAVAVATVAAALNVAQILRTRVYSPSAHP